MISLTHISKSYDNQQNWAVRDLSFEIASGRTLALVGESGCGKTTTLKMINRLIEPTNGKITIRDRDIASVDPVGLRRSIGYVFQEVGLFPHMTVAENIGIVPRLLGWTDNRINDRVDELLGIIGLEADVYRPRSPAEISGGQRQRVGLARALAAGPDIMLMDEPFGALDPITRAEVVEQFRQIRENLGLTVVLVTHDLAEALILADKIAVMKSGEVVALGTPEDLLNNPEHPYARQLLSVPRRQAERLAKIAGKRGGA